MAISSQVLMIMVAIVVVVFFPEVARATQYTVGDATGWTINFNYTAWAASKVFRVGDTLVFKYPAGNHNVYKVNGTNFNTCTTPSKQEVQPLTTGNDIVTLTNPGKAWFLCGIGNGKHCSTGQKLVINVLARDTPTGSLSPAPAQAPTGHAPGSLPRKIVVWWTPTPAPSADADNYWP